MQSEDRVEAIKDALKLPEHSGVWTFGRQVQDHPVEQAHQVQDLAVRAAHGGHRVLAAEHSRDCRVKFGVIPMFVRQ